MRISPPGFLTGSDGKTLSIGRVMLSITFLIEILHWLSPFLFNREVIVPASLDSVFQSLVLYEVFKHSKQAVQVILKKKETPDAK